MSSVQNIQGRYILGVEKGVLSSGVSLYIEREVPLSNTEYNIPPVQVQLEVKVWFLQDQLRGSDTTEIRVKFLKKLEDAVPAGED